jgi:diadenosine tetraphosphate (Ap4A) HIT family hydrolase
MNKTGCPFCQQSPSDALCSSDAGFAFFDPYPITEGHTLVVPHRHVGSIYDLPPADQAELHSMVAEARTYLMHRYGVTNFTIGINDGLAAGQTVPHAHIHVIPRRRGDVSDPKGGVRWVIPDKAKYW